MHIPDGDHEEWHLSAGDDKRHEEEHDHERQQCGALAAAQPARRRDHRDGHTRLKLAPDVLCHARTVRVVLHGQQQLGNVHSSVAEDSAENYF